MSNREELAEKIRSLSWEDRAYLLEVIEESLWAQESDPQIAEAWRIEIERRAQAYERGEMKAEDWRTVMQRLRAERPSRNS
ncbi:MAG: addiction module protein [Planctomycetales bacterium]